MIYKWKTGYHKTDPNVAGKELERIESTIGLSARNVVEESRAKDAPLHNEFTWNNKEAAEKYREQEARVLIAALVVEIEKDGESLVTRGFVNLQSKDTLGEYEGIEAILLDEEKTSALLDKAKKELGWFRAKYSTLDELAGVFREIDAL